MEQAKRMTTDDTGNRIIRGPSIMVARLIFGLSLIFTIVGTISELNIGIFTFSRQVFIQEIVLLPLIVLSYGIVALLLISRHPKNVVGWLLLLQSLFYGYRPFVGLAGEWMITILGETPNKLLGVLFAASSETTWLVVQLIPITLIPLFFPSGKLLTRRWRFVLAATLIGIVSMVFSLAIDIYPDQVGRDTINPFGLEGTEAIADIMWNFIGTPFTMIGLVGGGTSLFLRYRRSTGKERTQIKWFFYLFLIVASLMVVPLFIDSLASLIVSGPMPDTVQLLINELPYLVFWVISTLFPVAIGFAILRYNLWSIDVVINRTVVYGTMTLLLILLFGGSLFAITTLFSDFTNGPLIAGILAAGIFGAGFQPMRRNLQRFVDQRIYNIQIDYQKTPTPLQRFSSEQADTHFGEYRNLELIGRGGMAEVYRAFPEGSNDPVAVKILPRDLAQDPDYRKRFAREVQVMQSLQHPNIINVHKHGEEQNLPYIVMEFIRGRDLADHMGHVGRISAAQTAEILSGTAAALDYAHGKGLIHRDIKPSNVMLDQESNTLRPVLMDFGIAKILGRSMMTNSGFLGTLDYISPEQIQGQEDINHQADIYSLAIMTYQMLTGEIPFPQKNPGAILLAHLTQPPPDIRKLQPQLSKDTAQAVITALSKSPEERFNTATEFVSALSLSN